MRERVVQQRDRLVVELRLDRARGDLGDRGERVDEDVLAVVDGVWVADLVEDGGGELGVGHGRPALEDALHGVGEGVQTRVLVVPAIGVSCRVDGVIILAIGGDGEGAILEVDDVCDGDEGGVAKVERRRRHRWRRRQRRWRW